MTIAKLALIFALTTAIAATQRQQTSPANMPKWEVVSVKPCRQAAGPVGGRGAGPGVARTPIASPDRLNLTCRTVQQLIIQAYLSLPNGRRNLQIGIEGGPSWINSEQYEINAKAEGTPGAEVMRGPMLRAILQERFKLTAHSEAKEVPVYTLSAAKGGFKLQPLQDGRCDPPDPSHPRGIRATVDDLVEVLQPGEKTTCGLATVSVGDGGTGTTVHALASNTTEFAGILRAVLDRPIVDRTSVKGRYNFHLHFAGAQTATQPSDPAGPSIFTAIEEQIGLKLESARGPAEFFIIDAVERPTEN